MLQFTSWCRVQHCAKTLHCDYSAVLESVTLSWNEMHIYYINTLFLKAVVFLENGWMLWPEHVIIALSKGSDRRQFQREGLTCTNMPACDLSLRTLSKEKHGWQHTHCWMPVLHPIFTWQIFFYRDNNVPKPTLHHFLCPVFILDRSLFAFSRSHIVHLINPTLELID